MISLALAAVLAVIYLRLRRKDPRMLRNGIVLVAACWFALTGAAQTLSQWFPWTQWITLIIVALTPFAIMVLAGFLIANGVTMMRREGRSLGNLLSLAAGLALILLPVLALVLVFTLHPVAIGVAALLFLLCSYFGVVFVIILSYAAVYGKMEHSIAPESVVILGSQIINGKVPPLLRSRLDKGLEIYRGAPVKPLLIPSGGQGADESRSEGAAMAEYLIAQGAPAQDVVPEEKAVNTAQNLQFSHALARENGRGGQFLIVTNNYHVLRAAMLSRKVGMDAQVVGAPTAKYFLPSAFLREFVAILTEHKRLHAFMCLPFVALTALFTAAVFLASR